MSASDLGHAASRRRGGGMGQACAAGGRAAAGGERRAVLRLPNDPEILRRRRHGSDRTVVAAVGVEVQDPVDACRVFKTELRGNLVGVPAVLAIRTARSRTSGACLLGRPIGSILSRNGLSDKPGTIQYHCRSTLCPVPCWQWYCSAWDNASLRLRLFGSFRS